MRYVYVIRNMINGKIYIGQTKNLASRKAGHFYVARKGNPRPLYASIRKHGKENFSFEVLEECADEFINEREQHWITHFDSFNSQKGYNLTNGGNQHFNHSEETKKRIGEYNRKFRSGSNHPMFGRKNLALSQRNKNRKGKAPNWTGRHHREDTKIAIGRANVAHQTGEGNSNFGKVWIHNSDLKLSRLVPKFEMNEWL